MPKAFDDMVTAIKQSLKKSHPDWKEDKLSSSAYAIATDRWKKSHNGKSPTEKVKDWRLLEFYVPIEENFLEGDEFLIKGVAINETTTLNNVKYVAEELMKAAPTFRNVPILLDHKNEVKNIVGRTTERVNFNPTYSRIDYEARIMDKDIREMIRDGRIQNVSIGAKVDDLIEETDGSMKAIGIRGLEISIVAVPGDTQSSLGQALQDCYHLKEIAMSEDDEDEIEDSELNQEEDDMAEENTEEKAKEVIVTSEKAPVVEAKVDNSMEEMKKQLAELKELLVLKKELKEEVEEDKTKGEVSEEKEETLEKLNNLIVEKSNRGFALYRDYTKENSDTNLKRLVR